MDSKKKIKNTLTEMSSPFFYLFLKNHLTIRPTQFGEKKTVTTDSQLTFAYSH